MVVQINNMGTFHSEECNSHKISWLTPACIPETSNMVADDESRNFHSQDTEQMLNREILTGALKTLDSQPEIDLFASQLNEQLPVFHSF